MKGSENMEEKQTKNLQLICQNCKNYDRETKQCHIWNRYTARKYACDSFKRK